MDRDRVFTLGLLSVLLYVGLTPRTTAGIDPVRPGDKIEVNYLGEWRAGEVLEYNKGQARVLYTFIRETTGVFPLSELRFPNEEGSWMIWRDASGKFQIEGRLVGRSAIHVKIKKEDDSIVDVPIEKLSDSLKALLSKAAKAEKEFVDAALVRVGDQIELNYGSTWYPATVKKILPTGAFVEYFDGRNQKETEAEYKKLRYPNGEGPWADWTDISGEHKVKARYITHDETHVELLLGTGKSVRMERAKLAKSIETELAKRAILTRRPNEVEFDVSRVDYDSLPSWTSFGTKLPAPSADLLQSVGADEQLQLQQGFFEAALPQGAIDAAILVGGDQGWVAIGITPAEQDATHPISLQWINTSQRIIKPGPNFFEGEVIVGYSAEQQRLLTAEGLDLRGSATRFCTYRLAPGDFKATPEWKWSVPKIAFYSSKNELTAEFLGNDRILIGYGGTVTMWDMSTKRADYVVPSTYAEINLSPDKRHFFTNQYSHSVLIETSSGKPVANLDHQASGKFSQDGEYVAAVGHFDSKLIALNKANHHKTHQLFGVLGTRPTHSTGSPSIIDENWFCDGTRLWNLQRGMLTWTYSVSDLKNVMQRVVGDHVLAIGQRQSDQANSLCVGITQIPSATTVASIESVSEEQLYILRAGIRVRIDNSARDPNILPGIQRAMANAGWIEDAESGIAIKASAQHGATVTNTYSRSRFGGSGGDETISVSPWIQSLNIEYQQQSVWSTSSGGAPGFLMLREGDSLEAEVRKSETPSYSLFKNLELPDKVLAPKWKHGFGTTRLTPSGFDEQPVTP